jgi:hypothetical protein
LLHEHVLHPKHFAFKAIKTKTILHSKRSKPFGISCCKGEPSEAVIWPAQKTVRWRQEAGQRAAQGKTMLISIKEFRICLKNIEFRVQREIRVRM